jgi:hypothetical protein
MTKTLRAGTTGLLLSLALAAPAPAATVSVRVEGQSATLLPRTTVTPPDQQLAQPDCPPDSAANALDTAVQGNWDHQEFSQTILGETHDFSNSDYWAFWVFRGGHYVVSNGICTETLAAGEELLAAYEVAPAPDYTLQLFPLWIQGVPATAKPGEPVTVTVQQAACETAFCSPGEGHAEPRSGATVTAGGVTATTGADGKATLTLGDRGPVRLRATASGANPSASEPTCVSDGADGYCGTTAPDGTTRPQQQLPAAPAAAGPDRDPATVTITGIEEGQRFSRSKAPRELTASVESDPSGLYGVKLSLSRRDGGRCSTFSAKKERFRRARCGHHAYFTVGKASAVSYLLPKRLGRGRYVLDVVSIDGNYNRDPLARGRNRVVFTVK